MSSASKMKSSEIHKRLAHPIIDSDGHWREFEPIAMDYLKKVGGPQLAEKWGKKFSMFGEGTYATMSRQQKIDQRHGQMPWWGLPVKNSIDVATSFVPKLLHDRLPDMGMDFSVLYPTSMQLFAPYLSDDELRQAGSRALNEYAAEIWAEYSDRCTPVGLIPMNTPEEAVAELEHCKKIGIKAVALGSLIRRPIKALEGKGISRRYSCYLDVLGIDSPYDYDPVWAKCVELGYPVSFHSGTEGYGLRNSVSNFVFNHIGHFAEAGNAVAKAMFLGGVTRRFPKLKVAFLEGGVAWGCCILSDLVGHWEKRNKDIIREFNPEGLDFNKIGEYMKEFGGDKYFARFKEFKDGWGKAQVFTPENLDDFAAAGIEKKRDIYDLFVPNYYFGCEADDPTTCYAFASKSNPFRAKLNAILASDISHFDVLDMTEILEEAWELVEKKGMSEEDFRAFTFTNAADLWTATNPDFFKGTVVETQVSAYIADKGKGKS
jgi:predicted TIM-barrel fold metal-dependent hydrolase